MTPAEIAFLPYRPNVGMVLANPRGLVFAAQRLDSSADALQMPQGGIDAGEDPRTAALRELREETGIPESLISIEAEMPDWLTYDLPPDLVPKIWQGRFRGQKQRWFLLRYLGRDDQIDIETDHPEFSRWQWIAPDELIRRIVPFKRDVYTKVLTHFAPLLRN